MCNGYPNMSCLEKMSPTRWGVLQPRCSWRCPQTSSSDHLVLTLSLKRALVPNCRSNGVGYPTLSYPETRSQAQ